MEQIETDALAKALSNTRAAFQRENIPMPSILVFETPETKRDIICLIAQSQMLVLSSRNPFGLPVEHPDGRMFHEFQFYGFKLHVIAEKYALPEGGWSWV